MLDICGGALACDGVFVSEDQDVLLLAEEAVDVFEFAVGGFGVEAGVLGQFRMEKGRK